MQGSDDVPAATLMTQHNDPATYALMTFIRSALFLAVIAFFWISLKAFPNLNDPQLLRVSDSGDRLNQLAALSLAGMCLLAAVTFIGLQRYWLLASPALVALLVIFAAASVLSPDPMLALRKLVLAHLILLMGATLLFLPRNVTHFAWLMGAGIAATLGLCYFGVAFLPTHSIHQPTEILEPELAGDWRGLFQHKNIAGAASALMVFIGLFVWQAASKALGGFIAIGAVIFVFFSGSKTALAFLPVALLASIFILRAPSTTGKAIWVSIIVLIPLIFTLGSVLFAPIDRLNQAVLPDPSFTNRDQVWEYALNEGMERPLRGYGFQAFWRTNATFNSDDAIETWANRASHAHNSYLEAFLTAGIPGILAILWWGIIQPARDLTESQSKRPTTPLDTLFTRIWVYGLLTAVLESIFFMGYGPIWMTVLMALFGLRLQACGHLRTPAENTEFGIQHNSTAASQRTLTVSKVGLASRAST
ncbi:MAG: O-antigen ligase [Pseudomonadota bacterium]